MSDDQRASGLKYNMKIHRRRLRRLCLLVSSGSDPFKRESEPQKENMPPEHRYYRIDDNYYLELYIEEVEGKIDRIERLVKRIRHTRARLNGMYDDRRKDFPHDDQDVEKFKGWGEKEQHENDKLRVRVQRPCSTAGVLSHWQPRVGSTNAHPSYR